MGYANGAKQQQEQQPQPQEKQQQQQQNGMRRRLHVSTNSTANPNIFKSALQSGQNKSSANPTTCGRVNLNTF